MVSDEFDVMKDNCLRGAEIIVENAHKWHGMVFLCHGLLTEDKKLGELFPYKIITINHQILV